jgi:transposase-like protein
MDAVELRLDRLLQRLARENRQLLAMLRLGYSLRRAERILGGDWKTHAKPQRTPRKAASRGGAESAEG